MPADIINASAMSNLKSEYNKTKEMANDPDSTKDPIAMMQMSWQMQESMLMINTADNLHKAEINAEQQISNNIK